MWRSLLRSLTNTLQVEEKFRQKSQESRGGVSSLQQRSIGFCFAEKKFSPFWDNIIKGSVTAFYFKGVSGREGGETVGRRMPPAIQSTFINEPLF